MRIGVDLRPLQDRSLSGVGEYTVQLMTALFRLATEDQFVFFTNSASRSVLLPASWPRERYMHHHHRIPNKALNAALFLLRRPTLRNLCGPVDCFFAPNHNFLPGLNGVPLVLTVHDLSYHHYPSLFSRKKRLWHTLVQPRRIMREASALIAVSETTAKDCINTFHVPSEKIHAIHSGVTTHAVSGHERSAVRTQYQLPAHFLFSLSTHEPRKNLITLLDAYHELRRSGKYTGALVLAGTHGWSVQHFENAVKTHPFRKDILLLGYVPADDKDALYAIADCFLYLSFYEGFGFPPLEALAQGTPVVAGHHSSLAEVAGTGVIAVDVYNVHDVVQATRILLKDTATREKLREQGKALSQRYSWQRTAEATARVFHSLSGNAHRN